MKPISILSDRWASRHTRNGSRCPRSTTSYNREEAGVKVSGTPHSLRPRRRSGRSKLTHLFSSRRYCLRKGGGIPRIFVPGDWTDILTGEIAMPKPPTARSSTPSIKDVMRQVDRWVSGHNVAKRITRTTELFLNVKSMG